MHVDAGSRMVAMRQLVLRRNCTFSSSVAIGDPGRGRLTVRVRFLGNDRLLPRWAARRTVSV